MNHRIISLAALVLIFVSSCIAPKKYNEQLAENVRMQGEITRLTSDLSVAKKRITDLNSKLDSLSQDNNMTKDNLAATSSSLENLQNEHEKLQTLYDNVLKNSGKLNRDLAEQQERLLTMESDLESAKAKNDQLSIDLAEREKKVSELEKILADKEAAVLALKKKVTDALLNFGEKELTVEVRNGKVYVSLAEQLLFKSGSTSVDEKGRIALQQLAAALKDSKDIHIMVEGHTDNVPISRASQYMNDNWDLSVMRATTIVRILTNYGVSPEQVTASGKGEFSPVMENTTPENKQKNRRTEIILTPNLDELFKILEAN
ncbi:MAG TPA: OmpA family protein [Cyclobacteriaceae bacterium]|jgi:chemotaxis protein MotB